MSAPADSPGGVPAAGLMARAPVPGRTKTRLAAAIGGAAAARLAEAMLLDAAAALRALAREDGWRAVLFAEPPAAAPALAARAGLAAARPQAAGGLGARMLAALRSLAADGGGGPLLLMGADIPLLAPHRLREAAAALAGADLAFVPAEDGGYCVAAMRTPQPAVFDDRRVRWGGPHALADSLRLAGRRRPPRRPPPPARTRHRHPRRPRLAPRPPRGLAAAHRRRGAGGEGRVRRVSAPSERHLKARLAARSRAIGMSLLEDGVAPRS